MANLWKDVHHMCYLNVTCHYCYVIVFFGGEAFSSTYSHLTFVFRKALCFLLVFQCCLSLIVPKKCLFCHSQTLRRYMPALGLQPPHGSAPPPGVVFSLCACVLLLSVTDTRRYTVSHASAHPAAWPRAGFATRSESPDVAVPLAGLGVLGLLEAPLMNVMGPLFPLSKGMLIIFSSLIIWLMRD